MLKKAALAHLGITLMPLELCYQDIMDKNLVRILPEWSLRSSNLYIIYPSRRGLIPAIRYFIDFVAERLMQRCSTVIKSVPT